MAAFFLDTSTVLKRYVQETGTAWVQALAAPTVRHSLFVVRIALAETVAAITRRERGGSITPQDAATAVADFQLDFRLPILRRRGVGRTGRPSSNAGEKARSAWLLPRQPRSAQILTADSVQQQSIAAPGGSEINHGIHRIPDRH